MKILAEGSDVFDDKMLLYRYLICLKWQVISNK